MPSDLERFQSLKKEVDELKTDVGRAEGELTQIMQQLKDGFGCASLEEAKDKLDSLEEEVDLARTKFKEDLAEFEREYRDKL